MTIIDAHRVITSNVELMASSNARMRRAARRRAQLLAERHEANADTLANSPWGNELTIDEINEAGGFIITRGRWYC